MAAQSKLFDAAINCSCHAYVHPWTASCVNASAGLLLAAIPASLRIYTTVYLLALLMRLRMPTLTDVKRTIFGILQSTAFLVTNSYGFGLWVCLLRRLLGRFYFSTVSFIPTFIASFLAISVERPARRAPLAFYVANAGTETLWNMLEARGLVRSIPNGQVLIMGLSLSALLYIYRAGLHKTVAKDVTFKGLQVIIGREEEGPLKTPAVTTMQSSRAPLSFASLSDLVQLYDRLRSARHPSCPHKEGCASYALRGGLKPFLGGVGLQVGLKLLLNFTKIINFKMEWRKQIFNKDSLRLGLAMGSFSLLYKTISCFLRNIFGHDNALFAIPACLIGSIGLLQFPNTTVSLYLMWRALHLLYNWGIAQGKLHEVPHFNMFLYAFFTATLFHAAILEAGTQRPSYFKFLISTSGGRMNRFDTSAFDGFGLNSYGQLQEYIKKSKIIMTSPYPRFPMTI